MAVGLGFLHYFNLTLGWEWHAVTLGTIYEDISACLT
jgi:hypothetical protein